jgi:rhodanese-related sulfurtransferase
VGYEPLIQAMAIEDLLEEARSGLVRLDVHESLAAAQNGGLIVDIRSEQDRARHGVVPGSHFVARNVLEWRFDSARDYCDPEMIAVTGPLVLMCAEGYQSSLAAAALQRMGVANATDMIGGFDAWRTEGFPVLPPKDPSHAA